MDEGIVNSTSLADFIVPGGPIEDEESQRYVEAIVSLRVSGNMRLRVQTVGKGEAYPFDTIDIGEGEVYLSFSSNPNSAVTIARRLMVALQEVERRAQARIDAADKARKDHEEDAESALREGIAR